MLTASCPAKKILQWTFGLLPIIVGLDKLFFSKIAIWESYASPLMIQWIPFSVQTFFLLVGVVEIVLGLLILTRWTKIGSTLLGLWLLGISFNLVLIGAYDVALRDVALACGAFALGCLENCCKKERV